MAGKVSKNSRTSRTGGAAAGGSHDQRTIIPLNQGKHAYVAVGGANRHVATDSPAFVEAIKDLGQEKAPRIRTELEALVAAHPEHGWDRTLARLQESGAI